jgi:hypothetical protein
MKWSRISSVCRVLFLILSDYLYAAFLCFS